MRNILQLYKDVLRELDKYNSPSFETEDFNYFFNKARLERCNLRYKEFETSEQLTDDLGKLVKHKIYPSTEIEEYKGALPSDYFHLLKVVVTFKYKDSVTCKSNGATFKKVCRKLTADREGFILNRRYFQPNIKRVFYKREGDNVVIYYGEDNNVEIVTIDLEYLCYPKKIQLNLDYTSTPLNDVSEFSDYIDNEDIKICVSLFLENVEQRRVQTFIPISKTI